MSSNQNKLPRCPRCTFRMVAQIERERLWCQACGYERTDADALAILQAVFGAEAKLVFPLGFQPDLVQVALTQQQQALLEAAVEAMQQGNKQAARYLCDDLLNQNHRILDAYYILYVAAETPIEKARHLASILALEPQHRQAKRELNRLKPLVGENIKPSFFTVYDHREQVQEYIHAKGRLEDCPMCGGHTLYIEEDRVKCLSCNYSPAVGAAPKVPLGDPSIKTQLPPNGGFRSLREALWQRKYGGGREWVIAKRVLACQNCGAQLTLSRSMMTQQCAFCDSQHVIFRDSLGSFQEPDVILPAQLSEQEATQRYLQSLSSKLQRWVARHEMVGLFLPYWSFRVERRHVVVAGSREPSPHVLEDLMPFHLKDLRPYDQRYLAQWSAQLYTNDAIQASVVAGALSNELTEYRLMLLPVWAATIHLQGGGYYHSLINAQTGEIVTTERVDSQSDYRSTRPQITMPNISDESVIRPLSPIRPLPPRS